MGKSKRNREVSPDGFIPDYEEQLHYEEDRNRQAERWKNRKRKDRNRDDYDNWDN